MNRNPESIASNTCTYLSTSNASSYFDCGKLWSCQTSCSAYGRCLTSCNYSGRVFLQFKLLLGPSRVLTSSQALSKLSVSHGPPLSGTHGPGRPQSVETETASSRTLEPNSILVLCVLFLGSHKICHMRIGRVRQHSSYSLDRSHARRTEAC